MILPQETCMKLFIDTANIQEIEELYDTGMVDGVTTNPSLIARTGRPVFEVLEDICRVVSGPVSAEVVSRDVETILLEGRKLASLSPNVVIKVPLTPAGLQSCKQLRSEGFMVNVTLCFSVQQAILAAKAQANFVSPFLGRLEDSSRFGVGQELLSDICTVYRHYPQFKTQILAASIRTLDHIRQMATLGVHAATLPCALLRQAFLHPLTDAGLKIFEKDWKEAKQSLLIQQ